MKIKTIEAKGLGYAGQFYTHTLAKAVEKFSAGVDIKNMQFIGEDNSLVAIISYEENPTKPKGGGK